MLALDSFSSKILTLTEKELFFLANTFGFNRIPGIHNPFSNQKKEEWVTSWKQISVSLLQKGYISGEELEQLLTHPPVNDSVRPFSDSYKRGCCLSYINKASEEKAAANTYHYLNTEGVFEISKVSEVAGDYLISKIGELEQSCDHILTQMDLNSYSAAEMPALTLSREWFEHHIHHRDLFCLPQLTEQLQEITGDAEGAKLFAGVIADNRLYAEVQFSYWDEQSWQRQGAVLLADYQTNWIVRQISRQQDDWVVAVPLDREHFHHIMLDWVQPPAK